MNSEADYTSRIQEQYDQAPYPHLPINESHQHDPNSLYLHNYLTPYYLRNRQIPDTQGRLILDAGCGSGHSTLALVQANPGATVIGIDPSEQSIDRARERLDFHGYSEVALHTIPLEALPKLGLKFDYINCDEVLYILNDPVVGLQSLQSVLSRDGILRANLHSSIVRAAVLRAQELFQMLGLSGRRSEATEISLIRETMETLKDGAQLKEEAWKPFTELQAHADFYRMNFLLRGDKGYTVPQLFQMLRETGLEFISMLTWPTWELRYLFKAHQLPTLLLETLETASLEERLHLLELIHSSDRLIDFWCGHTGANQALPSPDYTASGLATARLHLHPQLRTDALRKYLLTCLADKKPFQLNRYIRVPFGEPIDPAGIEVCLLPLWEEPQPYSTFAGNWVEIAGRRGLPESEALAGLTHFLEQMEGYLYILIERSP